MIKTYYIYKNNKLGVWNEPFYTPYETTDLIELIARGCKSGQIKNFEELSLYKIFKLDDKTGKITEDSQEFILDLAQYKFEEEKK